MIPEHEDLARYQRLIYKVSNSTLRRLLAVGARSVTIDDVVQEYRIAWLTASRTFDPSMGVPWMPYLINGLRAHTFTIMRQYTFKLKAEQYAVSIWEQVDNEEGNGGVIEGSIAGTTVDPLEQIMERQQINRAKKRLSKRAAQFLELLADTPQEIVDEVIKLREKAKFGQTLGLRSGASMRVTASMILDLMDAGRAERLQIMREVKNLGEKMCQK